MIKREFIKTLAAASAATFMNPMVASSRMIASDSNAKKKMLMLGGRGFIGPSIVKVFLNAGFHVTLLNRGKTNATLFNDLPVIICDREKENREGYKKIDKKYRETYWDIVIDTWQKSPKAVSDFLDEFKGSIGHYHYISTMSVYDKWDSKFIEETAALNPLPSFPETISTDFRYAIRKTLCEEAIRERMANYTIYRSHGMKDFRVTRPHDPNAEPFWPVRFNRGGEILLPNIADHHIQVTDVQSLSNFILHCAESGTYGAYNVAYHPTPFKDFVSSLISATGMPDKLHWIDGDFLITNELIPYKIVPLWKPEPKGSYYFNVQKAVSAGLVNRPMVDMVTDQLNGYKSRHPNDDVRFGEVMEGKKLKYYSMEKERDIIKKWVTKRG